MISVIITLLSPLVLTHDFTATNAVHLDAAPANSIQFNSISFIFDGP